MQRLAAAALCLGITIALGGCHRRTVATPLPTAQVPVEIINTPADAKAPVLETPQGKLPPIPVSAAAAKPKRERKHTAKTAVVPVAPEPAAAAIPTASASSNPEANSIGALTTGAPADPQTRQDAANLIAAIQKRLNAVPAQMDEAQKTQINKVRNFWRDAQEAFKSGDVEGAMTLATKAKLLLDDQQQ